MTTLETLQTILMQEFELTRDRVTPDAELAALGVDSLDRLELLFDIEDRFGVTIGDDVPADLTTVADVVRFIDGLASKRSAAPLPDDGRRALP